MSISIISIRCRVKPATPQEVGYTCWDVIKKAMDKQSARPLCERIRPCHKHGWWWIEQVPWCIKCEDAILELLVDGEKRVAEVSAVNGKKVDLASKETGEIFTYTIGRGFE